MTNARYGAFTFRTQCRHCGHPVPVNLPAREAHCTSCQQTTPLPAAAFVDLLYAFDDDHAQLGGGASTPHNDDVEGLPITATYRRVDKPLCEKCKQPYREERIADGESKDIFCSACGDPASTTPVPAWLSAAVPQARQIVSVDRGAGGGEGPAPELETDARPVVMACPRCGGSLSITKDSSRMLPCQYCPAEVYLPDPVWLRLHPARVVREWYVRFDGPSRPELASRAAAEQRDRERADAARANADREVRVDQAKRSAYAWLGLLYGLAALTMTGALISVATDLSVAPGHWKFAALVVLVPQAVVALLAYDRASAVLQIATDADSDHMMGWVGLWALFGLFVFPFGPIVFCVALYRIAGNLGASAMKSGGRTTYIEARKLRRGEGIPIGLFLLAQCVLLPAEGAVLIHQYGAVGSCKTTETIGAGGRCVSCGRSGDVCCPGSRNRCSCGTGLVLDPTSRRCAPRRP